jgi:hypothetical protein
MGVMVWMLAVGGLDPLQIAIRIVGVCWSLAWQGCKAREPSDSAFIAVLNDWRYHTWIIEAAHKHADIGILRIIKDHGGAAVPAESSSRQV